MEHNNGNVPSTSLYKPWKVEVYIFFTDRKKAYRFERYLKGGSGIAFARRHFINFIGKQIRKSSLSSNKIYEEQIQTNNFQ